MIVFGSVSSHTRNFWPSEMVEVSRIVADGAGAVGGEATSDNDRLTTSWSRPSA
jgi:hypothetical protein